MVNKKTLNWLQGKNEEIYNHFLKLIEIKDLYHKLDKIISSDTINNINK